MRKLRFCIQVLVSVLMISTLIPATSVFAEEDQSSELQSIISFDKQGTEVSTDGAELIGTFDYLVENDNLVQDGYTVTKRPLLKSNQAFGGGGSAYSLVSRTIVDLKFNNTAYKALMIGGFGVLNKGAAIAASIAQVFGDGYIKTYKYMRQSIYKKTD
ncbi:hypothetical protein [Listeria fleischmannii]|uniref:Uncharacterized protein n=1 Tax=Listeria fleischmannii FSL S10-1203 TaxID=1265822 RepID=W7DL01_9LIST|nr:hypothetical protein [Listeria fleischmannii]EUJ52954.1 hypothetical protein MCOL2_11822 [Listeria fleischmannii FSL S10-1203]